MGETMTISRSSPKGIRREHYRHGELAIIPAFQVITVETSIGQHVLRSKADKSGLSRPQYGETAPRWS